MQALDWAYLLAGGIVLIGVEAIFLSFFLFWIGIGFIIVALLSYFGLFESLYTQFALAFSIGLVLVFALRKWSMELINKTQDDTEERIHQKGTGIVDHGMIKMDGTFWQCDDDLSKYKDGDKVEVIDIVNNKAKLA